MTDLLVNTLDNRRNCRHNHMLGVIAYDRSTTSSLRIDTAIAGYLCSSDVELRVWAG